METLVDKAWDLHRLTAHFPSETILQASQWLETRHRKSPSGKLAVVIALHYILLALREDIAHEAQRAEGYYKPCRALVWACLRIERHRRGGESRRRLTIRRAVKR